MCIRDSSLSLEAQLGQVVIADGNSGLDTLDPDEYTQTLINQQKALGTDLGTLDGFSSLDNLLRLPRTQLENTQALIGSDLLFSFNSAELQDTAKTSLYKVAMLIDRNPEMYCWLEGHTDSIGSAANNVTLSQQRAQAVKDWLINTLLLPSEKIIVIGKGESQLIITTGDQEAQALNRRVEVKMRSTLPE